MVVDASAVVELLLGGRRGEAVATHMVEAPDELFHAPDILDVEVLQVLRRLTLGGVMSAVRAGASIELLAHLPVERRPTGPLVPRMWALRENLTAYDAAYVALAEALALPLLTLDTRLGRSPGHTATVLVVED